MPELAVVMSAEVDSGLAALVGAVQAELRLQGVDVTSGTGFADPGPGRVWCVVSPRECVRAGLQPPAEEVLRRTIVLTPEASFDQVDDAELEWLRGAGVVFALTPEAASALGRHGVSARLLRPGWSDGLDHFDPTAPRPVDIVVAGADTPRAAAWLSEARPVLAGRDVRSLSADDAALARSQLVVHVHLTPGQPLGWRPMLDAALSGAVLVAEHASDLAPFVPGEHLLVGSRDALAFVAAAALDDPERLSRIRQAAHERVHAWLPLALQVSFLRAAIVELLAVPVPTPG